jgi:hypothetical protein
LVRPLVLAAGDTDSSGGFLIDITTASNLLDFGARIGQGHRAQEQLEGAVAIHNILEKYRVAYLADEVGMGKTYVALGSLALFRHFDPGFRAVVIAPKENIQRKWVKEFGNFARHNVRFPDLRVTAIDRQPARPLVVCDNLIEFVREVTVDGGRDFFLRLSSFSLALGDDDEKRGWRRLRDELRQEVPWLPDEALDLRSNKDLFKDNFARALCCALPVFDLVIVDEGHNLKRGFKAGVAARNRVLALAFGHPAGHQSGRLFPAYGPRAKRVLFLSATPLEETYEQVWNQLDVFGLGKDFGELQDDNLSEDEKKPVVAKFLVRRLTTMHVGNEDLTKNQYRREWRRGGVHQHDEPIRMEDDRQRLVVALVQKKVAELLGSEKFNMSFQIGMLASFESFLETARIKRIDDESQANFDDPDQTDEEQDEAVRLAAREGIDVRDVNRLTRNYRDVFGKEMPHPKMDALVDSLKTAWTTGKKALIFVRRVKSVDELKRKLDEEYDEWLIQTLRGRLPASVADRFDRIVQKYSQEKREVETARQVRTEFIQTAEIDADLETDDRGGTDTFFAWFFRGEGPKGIVSGANVQRRFIQRGTAYSTFFEDNYVLDLLGARPGGVADALGRTLGLESGHLRDELRQRASHYIGRARRLQRADRMDAAQASALELLKERQDALGERARIVWHEKFETSRQEASARETPDVSEGLEHATFFSELRRPDRADLRIALWPDPCSGSERDRFREQQLRAQVLATAARLGHSLIDLFVLTIHRLGSLEQRTIEAEGEGELTLERRRIDDYLDLLEKQRITHLADRSWAAFDELAQIAENFDLVIDVNAPEARVKPLGETARYFASLLRQQQPVGGMSGQVNKTLVQQFRMPGYPFILVTTDLLQEGEDLHTFCSAVHHYGIAWTPSSIEQRIGRIDRVRSESDRRLSRLKSIPDGSDLLQVYYPHLEDTVEVLQVQRVLERMNTFLRLMHEGLAVPKGDHRRVDVSRELIGGPRTVEPIRGRLQTAFQLPQWALQGRRKELATNGGTVAAVLQRFERLSEANYPRMAIKWEEPLRKGMLSGAMTLGAGRIQPFAILLQSDGERLVVRCVSFVGRVESESTMAAVEESARKHRVRIVIILGREETLYDLTVEDDVLLGTQSRDVPRVAVLLKRVAERSSGLYQIHSPLFDQSGPVFEAHLQNEGRATVLDWRQLCHGQEGVYVDEDEVEVLVADERYKRVTIQETAESFELSTIVARPAETEAIPDVSLRAWRRNRAMQLIGFRIDEKDRLVGEAWVPKAGLSRGELLLYIKRVAAECDLFEYNLTGKNRE